MKRIEINNGLLIKLESAIKICQVITQTGGESKILINKGKVMVNGEIIKQRGKKD